MLHDYSTSTAQSVAALTDDAIERANQLVESVATDAGPLTYANTIAPLEKAGTILADAYGAGAFLGRAHPDQKLREVAIQAEERLTKWGNDVISRRDLFEAVDAFSQTDEKGSLAPDRARVLDEWLRDFRRAGHELDEAKRKSLHDLRTKLIELEVEFGKNVDDWQDHIDMTAEQLDGLPPEYIERLGAGDAPGTYRVSMDYPEYTPFIQQARNRDMRRRLQHKFWNRSRSENLPLLAAAVKTRQQIADILGYPTWAHYAMEVKMAKSPDAVADLYESIVPGLEKRAAGELEALRRLLEEDHPGETLESWDWAYYANEQGKRDYGIDPNEVAEYFPLGEVIAGMFDITSDVFDLVYRKVEDAQTWHPDVQVYEIQNAGDDEPIAYFYADLFPREGKYGHAAAFPLVVGRLEDDGTYTKPVAAILANFTKPSATQPSLLKHGEALTLFHEFGHILHFCLTTVSERRFAGFETEWDFVEAPSQIMEHWMWQPEVLQRFARHYETAEPIPADLVERLVEARDLHVGLGTLRQVFLGKFDLSLHSGDGNVDLDRAYRSAYAYTQLPFHDGTAFHASFGHLMGGYDAGYYGYQWAKVYGDDMFSVFRDQGILDPGVGMRYRNEVLARGAERDAIDHLRAFLGREPSSDAYLENLGLR